MNSAEQIKSQLDIVEVVGQYVQLKRQGAGQRWIGLCPFHSEKTPSFGVHSGYQYYKCFGCDAGGDVFQFVQKIESLTFPETLRLLAERYGIPMPERNQVNDPEAQRYAALLEIHEAAAELFQENLRGASGAETRDYLASRGVAQDAAREFRLGLSDGSGQQLVRRLNRFGDDLLIDSGLALKRPESAGVYDRFRARLMFPIHNGSGKLIAFGGRALRKEEKVKYLNSPETRLYSKSSVLYNLHRAKIAARKNDRIILVEGYMDAIGIYSVGIQEVVALCGTALGNNQIRSMKQESSYQSGKGQVILNLDSDMAGSKSTEKNIAPLLAQGLRVKVVEIPGALDPDEYIQASGPEAYRHLLDQAPSYFHWLTEHARRKFDTKTAEGRMDAFQSVLPALEHVHDRMERGVIATEIAERLGVSRELVQQAIRPKGVIYAKPKTPDLSSTVPPNEKLLIACMLASADARALVQHYLIRSGTVETLQLQSIFQALLNAESTAASFSLTEILASLEPRDQRILTEIGFAESRVSEEHASEQALDCLRLLEAKSRRDKCEDLKNRIRELELHGKLEEAFRLAEELDVMSGSSQKV